MMELMSGWNFKGDTSLHTACEGGSTSLVRSLLENSRADLNVSNLLGRQPLHVACELGHVHIAATLLACGASLDGWDYHGRTPLHIASERGHPSIVKKLIDAGAPIEEGSFGQGTPLHHACSGNQDGTARILLEKGANSNCKDGNMRTPLHITSETGNVELGNLLLSYGADMAANGKLHMDIYRERSCIQQSIICRKAFSEDYSHDHQCARENYGNRSEDVRKKRMRILLNKKPNVNSFGFLFRPLHAACEYGHFDLVKTLVEHGAGIDDVGPEGTPLHYASKNEHAEVMRFLLSKGANMNATDSWGVTPLHTACENGKQEAVNILLSFEADIEREDVYSRRPLHIAVDKKYLGIVESLVVHGADVNETKGRTEHECCCWRWNPFHRLVDEGKNRLLKLLLSSKGARTRDINFRLELVTGARQREIVRTLMAHNIDEGSINIEVLEEVTFSEETTRQVIINGVADVCCLWNRNKFISYCRGRKVILDYAAGSGKLQYVRQRYDGIREEALVNGWLHAKNKAAGLPGLRRERTNDSDSGHNFPRMCFEELGRMKDDIIENTNATYHDLLIRNLPALRNQPLVMNFNSDECLKKFPIYGDLTICSYLRLRRFLLNDETLSFFSMTEPPLLPECAEEVIAHLGVEDMENLVKVVWPTNHWAKLSLRLCDKCCTDCQRRAAHMDEEIPGRLPELERRSSDIALFQLLQKALGT